MSGMECPCCEVKVKSEIVDFSGNKRSGMKTGLTLGPVDKGAGNQRDAREKKNQK
jgi:hypothetical protein